MNKLLWLAAPFVLALGVMAGGTTSFAASSAPPPTPPGQGDCSHGNTGKVCRPDPSTNGKDCDAHGNNDVGGVNEDHCVATTPTTTTDETTTTQTTNQSTSTTATNQTTTAPVTTTDSSTSSQATTTATAAATTNTGSSKGTLAGSVSSDNNPLPNQAAVAGASGVSPDRAASGELPFTGLPVWILALVGSAMLAAGWGVRRLAA